MIVADSGSTDKSVEVAKPLVKEVIHSTETRGLLLLSCGTYDSTIRWIPPLNVTDSQIWNSLNIYADSLKAAVIDVTLTCRRLKVSNRRAF